MYAQRKDGKIVGLFNRPQDFATEKVDDAHPDVIAYRAAKPYPVRKTLILERLEAVGLFDAADKGIETNRMLARKWQTSGPIIWSNDDDALAFLQVIGGDPAVILAPE